MVGLSPFHSYKVLIAAVMLTLIAACSQEPAGESAPAPQAAAEPSTPPSCNDGPSKAAENNILPDIEV